MCHVALFFEEKKNFEIEEETYFLIAFKEFIREKCKSCVMKMIK